MKAATGTVDVYKSGKRLQLYALAELTPAQAMKLASRLQRWAWNVLKEKKR